MLIPVFRTIRRTISKDENDFSIDGMWNPKFFNLGEVEAIIQGDVIPANGSFDMEGNPNGESVGNVTIRFKEDDGKKLVRCIAVVLDHVKEVDAKKC